MLPLAEDVLIELHVPYWNNPKVKCWMAKWLQGHGFDCNGSVCEAVDKWRRLKATIPALEKLP